MGPAVSPGRASLYSALEEKLGTAESAGDTRYSFFNSNLDTVTHADDFSQLQTTCEPFKDFRETGVHDGLWWLHVASPSDDDIEFLSRMFGLHPLTTEDIKVRELREKVELFGAYYFVSVLPPRQLGLSTVPNSSAANFYGIVFPEGILSITFGDGQDPAHVWKRIKDHQSDFSPTSDWICYALIDDIVDGFAPLIDRVQTGVEMMEDGLSVTRPDEIGLALQNISKCRKEVTQIRRLLHDKTDLIRCFARHCGYSGATAAEITLYLRDIQDHVLTMMSNLTSAEQMLSRSQSKYLGRLEFDSTCMRNSLASTLSRVTIIGTIVVTMQVISGSFGMNINVPGQYVEGNCKWWFGILAFILGFAVLFILFAKRVRIL
ncbi:uncharacterized protein N7484_002945 [Penicillium longicatenatum]|uniref:uncharacterized protein n=1 Tax=Penicillium longicatenatum TaxID=1561947 RepID=UPI002547A886|nr:uncharacterized protein N7484_002945 [Penicillium longicatenatum]KAJ5649222.1 hypothetical protein N7484_002945 [Penicillium longicatenatum]KAJ5673285.1 hypothetical protein N7507_002412 [Penicillium longicatenatum]